MGARKKARTEYPPDHESDADSDNDSTILERIPLPPKPVPPKGSVAWKIHDFTLEFLHDLSRNNNREWFAIHKNRYDASHDNILAFTTELIRRISEVDGDLHGLEPKRCMHRIYRDIRFSHDKTPYKPQFGIVFRRDGRKSNYAAYYLEITPGDKTFFATGLWTPPSSILSRVRATLSEDASGFRDILHAESLKTLFGHDGETLIKTDAEKFGHVLKTAPKGFPKDHPEIELLKLKSYEFNKTFTDADVQSDGFLENIVECVRTTMPFVHYLNEIIDE